MLIYVKFLFEKNTSFPSTKQSKIFLQVYNLLLFECKDDIRYLIVGYYLGFVYQKGMEERLQRLEKAVSYLESFLDVLKRSEILTKEEEKQYEGYLELI